MEKILNTTRKYDGNNSQLLSENNEATYSGETRNNIHNLTEFQDNETLRRITFVSHAENEDVKIYFLMLKICLPILIVGGTFGNILIFYIMRKGSLKNVSTCLYMSILAISDTAFLWIGAFADNWLFVMTNFTSNPWLLADCKIFAFCFLFSAHCSSALLTLMSVEKFIALYFPLKARSICTVKTAKRASIVALILLGAYNSQNFFIWRKVTTPSGNSYCTPINVDVANYMNSYYRHLDSVIWSFGPFATMLITNSAICYKFMVAKIKSSQSGTESTSQALSKSAVKGTTMLITVSFAFIILTGPAALDPYINHALSMDPIARGVAFILQYSNHSINAVLYCIVGSKFRAEVLQLLCCRRSTRPGRSSTSVSSTVRTVSGSM